MDVASRRDEAEMALPPSDQHETSETTYNDSDNSEYPWPPYNEPWPRGPLAFARDSYELLSRDNPDDPNLITISVGEYMDSVVEFQLPKESLIKYSLFFRNALKTRWNPDARRTISLEFISPAVFDLFARWLDFGAQILIHGEDWKASFTEYLYWRQHIAYHKLQTGAPLPFQTICPGTVWNFDLTVQAWMLGDFLQCPDFQNNCMGYLYYMNLRFDHILADEREIQANEEDLTEALWHEGTIAYFDPKDIVYFWENSIKGCRNVLREFFSAWLKRYWDTYAISSWDRKARDGIDMLMAKCPDLMVEVMTGVMNAKEDRRVYCVRTLSIYWVDELQDRWRDDNEEGPHNEVSRLGEPHRRNSVSMRVDGARL
ncbi:hypothetical protein EJ04DRAFT_6114 [Polyplosphaeria fusca]|uniref:BTB domain-containing protein n=1 Tax=Polyplosphaeria fusca TaxID=682080 RepID=A0A9P4RDH7_9PLEO|nr:hypothetical protein EJ04DRAFT_6114 [Polyplosphaeria fusca]